MLYRSVGIVHWKIAGFCFHSGRVLLTKYFLSNSGLGTEYYQLEQWIDDATWYYPIWGTHMAPWGVRGLGANHQQEEARPSPGCFSTSIHNVCTYFQNNVGWDPNGQHDMALTSWHGMKNLTRNCKLQNIVLFRVRCLRSCFDMLLISVLKNI